MGKAADAGKDAELDAKDRRILSELDMDARQLRRDLSKAPRAKARGVLLSMLRNAVCLLLTEVSAFAYREGWKASAFRWIAHQRF